MVHNTRHQGQIESRPDVPFEWLDVTDSALTTLASSALEGVRRSPVVFGLAASNALMALAVLVLAGSVTMSAIEDRRGSEARLEDVIDELVLCYSRQASGLEGEPEDIQRAAPDKRATKKPEEGNLFVVER